MFIYMQSFIVTSTSARKSKVRKLLAVWRQLLLSIGLWTKKDGLAYDDR
jgi:hypothetical protein